MLHHASLVALPPTRLCCRVPVSLPPPPCLQVPQRLDSTRAGGASMSSDGAGGGRSRSHGGEDQLSSLGNSSPAGRRLTIKLYLVLQSGSPAPMGTADGVTLTVTAPEPLTVETVSWVWLRAGFLATYCSETPVVYA